MISILKEREKTFDNITQKIFETFPFESLRKQKMFLALSKHWRRKIQMLLDDDVFFLLLEQFLISLKNAHTRLGKYPGKVWYSPLEFSSKFITKKFYLFSHDKFFGEIQKIDGVPPDKIFQYHKKRVPASTPHYRDVQAIKFLFFAKEKKPISLQYHKNQKNYSLIIPREKIVHSLPQEDTLSYKLLEPSIGFLRIASWNNSLDIQKQFVKIVHQLTKESIKKLIIDVRGNGGGDANAVIFFSRYFFKQPTFFGSVCIRKKNMKLVFEKKDFYIIPKHPYIDSKITILIDEQCLSSNEFFIAGFKDNHRAFTKGKRTGGSSGNPEKFLIPYKKETFELLVSTWRYFRPNGKSLEGKGIESDSKKTQKN